MSLTTAQFFASGVATLTFIVAPNAIAGAYPVSVLAAGGGVTRAVSLDLRVLAGGGASSVAGDWLPLLAWFVAAAAISVGVIYAIERRKK